MAEIPDGSVDMVLADLPYGSTSCHWDQHIDLARFWPEVARLISPGSAVVMFADMRYAAALIASRPKWFRFDLVWDKVAPVGFLNARRFPLRSHELMLVFGATGIRYRPQMSLGHKPYTSIRSSGRRTEIYRPFGAASTIRNDGSRFPVSIIRERNAIGRHRGNFHPTQKPVQLQSWLIRTFTDPGMTVLDPTMGSGSTGMACLEEGRGFIGMDRDPGYLAIARKRISGARRAVARAARIGGAA